MKKPLEIRLRIALTLSALFLLGTAGTTTITGTNRFSARAAQGTFPAPPTDRTLIYFSDEKNAYIPLPYETGTTPLRVAMVAKDDKRSYVEMNGKHAATSIMFDKPRFYLFLPDEANAKPPFLVRLTEKGNARRVTVMAQKGYSGFAFPSEEIVKPHYRVMSREGGMQFMEISLREPLVAGEYAIIGTDLQRVATFRVAVALDH